MLKKTLLRKDEKGQLIMKNIAIITGASSGMGKEFFNCVANSYKELDEIWVIARRVERLEELKALCPKTTVKAIGLDLTNDKSYSELSELLSKDETNIKLLINNAGCGLLGNVEDAEYKAQIQMVDLNCRALTALTTLALKFMREGSFIINVCSIAAFCPNARMTVYSATKAYVFSYSKSLRFELKKRKINILAVCPGPMDTEFLPVAGITGNSKTFDMLPRCNPAIVAKNALKKASKGRGIYTPRIFFKFYRVLAKFLPHGLMMHFSKT